MKFEGGSDHSFDFPGKGAPKNICVLAQSDVVASCLKMQGLKKYPLFSFLLVINFVGSVTSYLLGAWLIQASDIPKGVIDSDDSLPDEEKDRLNTIFIVALVVGILCFLFGTVLLWNAIDIILLMTSCGDELPCIGSYRKLIQNEMAEIVENNEKKNLQQP